MRVFRLLLCFHFSIMHIFVSVFFFPCFFLYGSLIYYISSFSLIYFYFLFRVASMLPIDDEDDDFSFIISSYYYQFFYIGFKHLPSALISVLMYCKYSDQPFVCVAGEICVQSYTPNPSLPLRPNLHCLKFCLTPLLSVFLLHNHKGNAPPQGLPLTLQSSQTHTSTFHLSHPFMVIPKLL